MVHISCRVADSRREIDEALRLRWTVFGEELGLLHPRATRREIDDYDTLETTVHLLAYVDGAAVATFRLILPSPDVALGRGWGLGLDIEERFDLGALADSGVSLAEVTRICVLRAFRRRGVAVALLTAMVLESRRLGVTHWVGVANTETDAADDAAIVTQVAAAHRVVSPSHRLLPRTVSAPPQEPRARFYTGDARRGTAQGDLAGLALPRPLEVLTRMGFRLAGAPVYDVRFKRFAVPVVAVMDEMAVEVPARSVA